MLSTICWTRFLFYSRHCGIFHYLTIRRLNLRIQMFRDSWVLFCYFDPKGRFHTWDKVWWREADNIHISYSLTIVSWASGCKIPALGNRFPNNASLLSEVHWLLMQMYEREKFKMDDDISSLCIHNYYCENWGIVGHFILKVSFQLFHITSTRFAATEASVLVLKSMNDPMHRNDRP